MKRLPIFLVVIFSCLLPFIAQAEIKTLMHTVRQPFGGSQSPDDARIAAIVKAKREVLERAGTYLESLTIVEEAVLTKDRVLALASGILKAEIVSQENYVTKDGFGIIVKARVQVDTSLLEERVKKLMADRTAMEQLTASHKREKELLNKIEVLEEENRNIVKQVKTKATQEKEKALTQRFKQSSRNLNALYFYDQAFFLFENGKYLNPKKAIELLNKAIELDPDFAWSYNNRGIAYDDLKHYMKAIRDFNKAIELDPNISMPYNNLGAIYIHLKQYAEAIQNCNKALKLDPNSVMAYHNRGIAYSQLKQYKKAIHDYNRALGLNPNYAVAYAGRGIAFIQMGLKDKGCNDFRKACELGDCSGLQLARKFGDCLDAIGTNLRIYKPGDYINYKLSGFATIEGVDVPVFGTFRYEMLKDTQIDYYGNRCNIYRTTLDFMPSGKDRSKKITYFGDTYFTQDTYGSTRIHGSSNEKGQVLVKEPTRGWYFGYKCPLNTHESVTQNVVFSDGSSLSITDIIYGNENISCPAAIFNAVKIIKNGVKTRLDSSKLKTMETTWLVPEIGPVRINLTDDKFQNFKIEMTDTNIPYK